MLSREDGMNGDGGVSLTDHFGIDCFEASDYGNPDTARPIAIANLPSSPEMLRKIFP